VKDAAGAGPELLDAAALRAALQSDGAQLAAVDVVQETVSTNADLLERPANRFHRHALFAEQQSGGRGRRGRRWYSPFARNLYLSLGWRFAAHDNPGAGPLHETLSFLPLVVAVAVARACERLGLQGHGVKWPNDIVMVGADAEAAAAGSSPLRKLAGCLVELRGGDLPGGVVIGVGLNVHLRGASEAKAIDQPWSDLGSEVPGVTRGKAAVAVLAALVEAAETFAGSGFEPFRADWSRFDVLAGRPVTIVTGSGTQRGRAAGLGPRGGLLLKSGDDPDGDLATEFLSGDASLRLGKVR